MSGSAVDVFAEIRSRKDDFLEACNAQYCRFWMG